MIKWLLSLLIATSCLQVEGMHRPLLIHQALEPFEYRLPRPTVTEKIVTNLWLLVIDGNNINQLNRYGETPLDYAVGAILRNVRAANTDTMLYPEKQLSYKILDAGRYPSAQQCIKHMIHDLGAKSSVQLARNSFARKEDALLHRIITLWKNGARR